MKGRGPKETLEDLKPQALNLCRHGKISRKHQNLGANQNVHLLNFAQSFKAMLGKMPGKMGCLAQLYVGGVAEAKAAVFFAWHKILEAGPTSRLGREI